MEKIYNVRTNREVFHYKLNNIKKENLIHLILGKVTNLEIRIKNCLTKRDKMNLYF